MSGRKRKAVNEVSVKKSPAKKRRAKNTLSTARTTAQPEVAARIRTTFPDASLPPTSHSASEANHQGTEEAVTPEMLAASLSQAAEERLRLHTPGVETLGESLAESLSEEGNGASSPVVLENRAGVAASSRSASNGIDLAVSSVVRKADGGVISVLGAANLRKAYRKRTVVNDVSLEIRQGEIVGLLGPNGAGKTTVFYMIVGLERPDGGKVYLDSKDISRQPMYLRARDGISYLPQEASVFRKLTVEENILLVLQTMPLSRPQREHRLEELLNDFDIERVRHTKAYQLSGGERRRTEIARCLVIEPRFILLDEPFAGIDPIAVIDIQRILQRLRARGIGVLITDHNVRETLAITDRAYIINEGKIFRAGTPEALTRDAEVKRVYLGENFRM